MPTMKRIDTKSFLTGILAAVLIMVTAGAVPKAANQAGRFQLVPSTAEYSLFDTATGDYYENNPKESWKKTTDIE